jgi:hypothetical protein
VQRHGVAVGIIIVREFLARNTCLCCGNHCVLDKHRMRLSLQLEIQSGRVGLRCVCYFFVECGMGIHLTLYFAKPHAASTACSCRTPNRLSVFKLKLHFAKQLPTAWHFQESGLIQLGTPEEFEAVLQRGMGHYLGTLERLQLAKAHAVPDALNVQLKRMTLRVGALYDPHHHALTG